MSLVVFCLVMMAVLVSPAKAATLVNDFSGAVSGYGFTDPLAAFYAMSSPSASPTATGNAGQVDVGYYTVNYRDMPNFATSAFSTVNGFSGDLGIWNGSTGFYEGGTYFDLAGVTGFSLSLRKENFNTASIINFYILTNRDTEISIPIDISGLSLSTFTDVSIDLANFGGYSYIPGLQAAQIAIKGDSSNDSTINQASYNFSVDSLRTQGVPEPSSGLLLVAGLGALALLRRRFR
jgi:opacity protein-like surface antigen